MNSRQAEILAISAVTFTLGYVVGLSRGYSHAKISLELLPKFEAASRVRAKILSGAYNKLSDADKRIAMHEDYEFHVLAVQTEMQG